MKAFSCPQCGALLQNFSIEQNIARCDYCGAKILIRPLGEINPKTGEEEFEFLSSLVLRAVLKKRKLIPGENSPLLKTNIRLTRA